MSDTMTDRISLAPDAADAADRSLRHVGPAIVLRPAVAAAVAKWADTDANRPHLRMVVFRDDEMVACDGRRLVRVPCPTYGLALGVDRDHLLAAVAAQRELELGDRRPILTLRIDSPERISIGIGPYAHLVVPRRDPSTYPSLESAMPKESTTPSPDGYVLDPRYLAAIVEVNAAMRPEGNRGVTVARWGQASHEGQLLTAMQFENLDGARFIVMPMSEP